MTTSELITDEIARKAYKSFHKAKTQSNIIAMKAAILAIQDDITRPYRNLLEGWKQNSEAYERALREIRNYCEVAGDSDHQINKIVGYALKGDYHKTDFTEFCEQNPITEHPS